MEAERRIDVLEARLEGELGELQIKLAYAEDLLDTLNTTVFRQQQQLDLLQEQLRMLRQQFNDSLPGEQRSLRDEVPPHY
ncbi:MAG: SlyX family protein [Rhodocyclaceae bacterium]|nr:SlyX family protein [Rhodocyclaceae bacterium]